ncbi:MULTISPECIES: DUF4328 domain-containing protein [unclassified Streptomyces]|uniref:DUF4328 domain-containing protein n=1 Tax=unclassified Streptomyces TaxID=2593676 RepID=UPI000B0A4BD5|nr:DUF4328 domain-containing protein [Streptomyces sp. CB02400]
MLTSKDGLSPHPPLPSGMPPLASRGLLIAVVAAFAAAALGDLFAVYTGVRLRAVVDGDVTATTASSLESAYSLYERAGQVQVATSLLCAVLFITWFFQMRRRTELLAPNWFRKGPGWAIGAWFIPVANLWLPYRIASDMWNACAPLPTEGKSHRLPMWPVNLWWGLFVGTTLLGRFTAARLDMTDSLSGLSDAVTLYLAVDLLYAATAGAAVVFVVRLTALERLRVTEGPYWTPVKA